MTARTPRTLGQKAVLSIVALCLLAAGVIGWQRSTPPVERLVAAPPARVETLIGGVVATLDSPAFHYSPGWQVSALGADPSEPIDPWIAPAGVITFSYTGADLLLQLALGDYWGYLYVTVDNLPANQLTTVPGNTNHEGATAGYRTFYAPELQRENATTPQWILVHRASDPTQRHDVRIEVWRSWSQTPLRAVAIDAQTPPPPARWPFVALLAMGLATLTFAITSSGFTPARIPGTRSLGNLLARLTHPMSESRLRTLAALLAVVIVAAGVWLSLWWLPPIGLTLLGYASLRQPSLWAAALLFALPYYYSQTVPILPGRATNLIDVGVFGALLVTAGAWLLRLYHHAHCPVEMRVNTPRPHWHVALWIFALTGWSLVAASDAAYSAIALREWRTLFLAAALFALLLLVCRDDPDAPWLLLVSWIAGGVTIALIGLGQFATDAMLIEAEGVHRVRSLYGSPNNLALYLERTLMPTLALLLLLPNGTRRWLALLASIIQSGVLLLTFSKGALILGLPAGLVTLWLGGLYILRRRRAPTRPLWWLAAIAALAMLALLPFLGTERFQQLLNFNSGTGFTRLQLWRSSLQMAIDHWWLGVGPDNFLYAYRSEYILPAAWQEPDLNHPHTWLLDWWTRLGMVGMILGIGWWVAGLVATWQKLRQTPSGMKAALWLGTLAAMIAALSHGLIDLSYAVSDLMLVWVLLTLLPVIDKATAAQKETSPQPPPLVD
jgi:O-antigen ligase